MNKDNIIKGCIWVSGLCFGTIIGGFLNEKLKKKYVVPHIENYRNLAETFKDELGKAYNEVDKLKGMIKEDEA